MVLHGLTAFVSRLRSLGVGSLLGAALLAATAPLAGQAGAAVEVIQEENFRGEPNGVLLGTLAPGTRLDRLGERDGWVEVEVEGWVWTRSMQIVDRQGFDLVISADGGENLRIRPQGPAAGRFVQGTLLAEQERIPGWVRVRRQGWIWAPSVRDVPQPSGGSGPDAAPPATEPETAVSDDDGPPDAAPLPPLDRSGVPLLASPDGDTLARVGPATGVEVLEREGGWVRVRLEGWMWRPDSATTETGPADVGPTRVAREPARWRGRVVTWALQFISLEEAEAIRTDFREGEPFLLTRASTERDAPFVYVAVPAEFEDVVAELAPLERITVTGRIRTGASVLTGSPILELIDLRRGGAP